MAQEKGSRLGTNNMATNGKTLTKPVDWTSNPRWAGITRPYTMNEVERLRGSIHVEHTLARLGAERLWDLLQAESYVAALGAMTGNQAIQQVRAGLQAIYVSGWQVAADANDAGQMYPDQSLYPADSVPNLVRRINQALIRADQIHHAEGKNGMHWFAPLIADAEAGFGGNLNAFELMKAMIRSQPGPDPGRPDPSRRGEERNALVRAPDCRRGSGIRRQPQRVRVDEGHDPIATRP